ncbi:MAG: DUF58 domain-containing protein [Phycisphaerales bacterium]
MLRTPPQPAPAGLEDLLGSKLVARLSQLDVTSRKVFAGKLKGERRSKKRGDSVEFADHRPYVVGDDLRRIDWNIFGRLDRLFLKLFLEEEDLSLVVLVDNSASMHTGSPSKMRFAQQVAAAIGFIGLANLHRVSLFALGGGDEGEDGGKSGVGEARGEAEGAGEERSEDERRARRPSHRGDGGGGALPVIRNLRGKRRAYDMGRWLCQLPESYSVDFEAACKRVALSKSGKGVMLLISDFMYKEGYEGGLRYLVGRGFDVLAVQVLSPQEVDPTIAGDLRLRDVEDGDSAEITVSAPLLKRYKANLTAYCDGLRQFCARREITHMTVQSDMAVDELVLGYLRSRGVVG